MRVERVERPLRRVGRVTRAPDNVAQVAVGHRVAPTERAHGRAIGTQRGDERPPT